jgi:hypothetical protein
VLQCPEVDTFIISDFLANNLSFVIVIWVPLDLHIYNGLKLSTQKISSTCKI